MIKIFYESFDPVNVSLEAGGAKFPYTGQFKVFARNVDVVVFEFKIIAGAQVSSRGDLQLLAGECENATADDLLGGWSSPQVAEDVKKILDLYLEKIKRTI